MAKISQSYETVMVFSCKNEEAIPALVEKFTTLISDNATVDGVEEWGKRRLAYPINYETEGYYVLVNYEVTKLNSDEKSRFPDRCKSRIRRTSYEQSGTSRKACRRP